MLLSDGMATRKKPKQLPPIAVCSRCELPIPDHPPSRCRTLVCLKCMAADGVDMLSACHICGHVLVDGICERCFVMPERQ